MRRALRVTIAGLAVLTAAVALPTGPYGARPAAASSLTAAWVVQRPSPFRHSSPTIGDLDGDRVNDIVVGGLDGWVHAYRWNGAPVAGWPRPVIIPGSGVPTAVESTPAVA